MSHPLETFWLADDGNLAPNNPSLPLIVYRHALPVGDPATIEAHFRRNRWSNAWVDGIYPFHHYHATAHEVLGIAAGTAEVQFGGPSGPVLTVSAGDAVLIPAGIGHCRVSASDDLSVVGAYPGGADWDLVHATPAARSESLPKIAVVPPPTSDPVYGSGGPACCAGRP
ncbi:MAG: cupin domain-containing protein [Hyphomicrobiaceae bacterium]|nr:cupin domain-containing protein [Hyphomicrobiaceae bacterium]